MAKRKPKVAIIEAPDIEAPDIEISIAEAPAVEPPAAEPAPIADQPSLRLEWRSPAELVENPRNWRTHPQAQVAALTDVLSDVGWAGACLYNETTGRLIDGHARRKVAAEQGAATVPVLIGRWTPEQEAKILLTLDPLASMAAADDAKLRELLGEVDGGTPAIQALLDQLAAQLPAAPDETEKKAGDQSGDLEEQYQILIECTTEQQQSELLARLNLEGLKCRSLIS
jgi:hypothetical protein